MNIGKKLILFNICAVLFPSMLQAAPVRITSYTQLVDALKNGHRVNSVTELKKCQLAGDSNSKLMSEDEHDSIGMSFNQGFFLISKLKNESQFGVAAIATNIIPKKNEGSVSRYKLIRVFEDNTVLMRAILADVATTKTLGWSEYHCKISLGSDENAVSLFDYDVL